MPRPPGCAPRSPVRRALDAVPGPHHFFRMLDLPDSGRRRLLRLGLFLPMAAALPAGPLAAACARATPPNAEGPFFKPGSPRRTSLIEPGVEGRRFVLEGLVTTRGCRPVPGMVVDLWHADASGEYDNRGWRLRGHQVTGADGRWRFETILPGHYPGRPRHYHVKVGSLTTQLYFPDDRRNARDGLFRPDLLLVPAADGGRFDFVL